MAHVEERGYFNLHKFSLSGWYMKMMRIHVKMVRSTRGPLKWRVQMQSLSVLIDGDHSNNQTKDVDEGSRWEGMNVCSGSYAVCSVSGAGLAVLRTVRVGEQAAAGVWVVGGHVRGALWWVVVLRERRTGGDAVTLRERTEWQQRHCLLTVNTAGVIARKLWHHWRVPPVIRLLYYFKKFLLVCSRTCWLLASMLVKYRATLFENGTQKTNNVLDIIKKYSYII